MGGDRTSVVKILDAATATGAGEAHQPRGAKTAIQAYGTTSSGSGAAAILIQVSMDNSNYETLATISLTLGTSATSDSVTFDAPWTYVRAYVDSISGTGASVSVNMGVEV